MAENKAENDDHQIAEDPPKANTGGTCGQPPIVRAESDDQPAAAKSYEDLVIRASEMEKRLAAIEAENNARRQAEVTRNEAEIAEISERLKQQGVAIEHMAGAPVAAWREMERFAKVNTTNKKVADYSASLGVASDLDDEIKFDPTTVYWASPSGGAN